MSSIIGVISKKGLRLTDDILTQPMKEMAYWKPDQSGIWHEKNVAFGNHLMNTTIESKTEVLPYYDLESKCCIVADARIDYRKDLAQSLEKEWSSVKSNPDSFFILEAYLKWGEDCVSHIYGDFAFAIWDVKTDKLFCARDHFGCRPFYYHDTTDFFYFSTEVVGLASIPSLKIDIDEEYLVNYMALIFPDKDKSPYEGICRLEPSNTLILKRNGKISLKKYWSLKSDLTIRDISEFDAISGLRSRFKDAVIQRSRTDSPIGVELSGGLDSSGIACTLSNVLQGLNKEIVALSQVLPNDYQGKIYPFKDEAEFSKLVVKEAGFAKHLLITGERDPGSLSAIINYLNLVRKPLGIGYAMLSDLLYQQANLNKIKILFSGFGGDEGVTSQASGYIEELLHDRKWSVLVEQLKEKYSQKTFRYTVSLANHFLLYHIPILLSFKRNLLIRRSLRFKRYFKYPIDSNMAKKYHLKSKYFKTLGNTKINSIEAKQYIRLNQNHISERLENSFFMAQSKGIEYRYPFWDVKLVEYYYSLPSKFKEKSGLGRYVFREAMKGIVPEKIRLRTDKSIATIPNAHFRLWKDELAYRKIIEESRHQNTYHYVDYDKLVNILDQLLSREDEEVNGIGPRAFFNAISILLLQKQQREGKIDLGVLY